MEPVTTRREVAEAPALYMAIEMSDRKWKSKLLVQMGPHKARGRPPCMGPASRGAR